MIIVSHQFAFTLFYQQLEDDPMEILDSVKICFTKALEKTLDYKINSDCNSKINVSVRFKGQIVVL